MTCQLWRRGTSEHLATVLRASLAAGQAAGTLVGAIGLHSAWAMSAVRGLVELLPWEPGHRAALCALSCRAGALNRLLDLVRVRHTAQDHVFCMRWHGRRTVHCAHAVAGHGGASG